MVVGSGAVLGGVGDEELEAKGRKREEEIAGMGVGGNRRADSLESSPFLERTFPIVF